MPYATLKDALVGESGFTGLTDQQTLDYGNATITIATDNTAYTWSGIGDKLTENYSADSSDPAGVDIATWIFFNNGLPTLTGTVAGVPDTPIGPTLVNCFVSGGFDFSKPNNRLLIQSFEVGEPSWAVATLNAMLAVGIKTGTRWQLIGLPQPLLADITAARNSIAVDNWVAHIKNDIIPPAVTAGNTIDQIKALIASS